MDIAFDTNKLRMLIDSANRYVKILKSVSLDLIYVKFSDVRD